MANIETLTKSVQKRLQEVGRMSPNWSIYRVPKRLRQVNADAYTPHLISIGPLHHNRKGLKDMQDHKWRYMLSLLRRVGGQEPTGEALCSCSHVILNVESEVRDWYAASIKLSSEELAMVLLLDGCFMLELFFRFKDREPSVVDNDPVFLSEWMVPAIRRDLVLLENQIPFFVLQRLFYVVVEQNVRIRADYLVYMALEFFRPALGPSVILDPRIDGGTHEYCKHVLDLLLKCLLPSAPRARARPSAKPRAPSSRGAENGRGDETTDRTSLMNFKSLVRRFLAWSPSPAQSRPLAKPEGEENAYARAGRTSLVNVKSLVRSGIVIKRAKTAKFSDFKFKNGELYIPPIHIYWWSESLFRNLIAFEHCCPNNMDSERGQYIVSYIVLMDQLIDSREDIELLKKRWIITSEVGGNEDVTHFFKDLSKQIIIRKFQFEDLCEEVGKYYESKVRGYVREFMQNHLNSPLKITAFFVAIVFFACTIHQAVYTVIRMRSGSSPATSA